MVQEMKEEMKERVEQNPCVLPSSRSDQMQSLPAAALITAEPSIEWSDIELADSIVLDAREHLKKALGKLSAHQPPYGSRWQPQVDAIRRDIPALRDTISCLHYGQKNITFDGRPPFPSDPMELQLREWAVENEFPHLAPVLQRMYDNPLSFPESLGAFNGRMVSRIMYCHARIVLAGIQYTDKPKCVVEIGGGYGEIARLWRTSSLAPAESYVIVDIPECLFFAEIALTK
jgi:hypothetical protein